MSLDSNSPVPKPVAEKNVLNASDSNALRPANLPVDHAVLQNARQDAYFGSVSPFSFFDATQKSTNPQVTAMLVSEPKFRLSDDKGAQAAQSIALPVEKAAPLLMGQPVETGKGMQANQPDVTGPEPIQTRSFAITEKLSADEGRQDMPVAAARSAEVLQGERVSTIDGNSPAMATYSRAADMPQVQSNASSAMDGAIPDNSMPGRSPEMAQVVKSSDAFPESPMREYASEVAQPVKIGGEGSPDIIMGRPVEPLQGQKEPLTGAYTTDKTSSSAPFAPTTEVSSVASTAPIPPTAPTSDKAAVLDKIYANQSPNDSGSDWSRNNNQTQEKYNADLRTADMQNDKKYSASQTDDVSRGAQRDAIAHSSAYGITEDPQTVVSAARVNQNEDAYVTQSSWSHHEPGISSKPDSAGTPESENSSTVGSAKSSLPNHHDLSNDSSQTMQSTTAGTDAAVPADATTKESTAAAITKESAANAAPKESTVSATTKESTADAATKESAAVAAMKVVAVEPDSLSQAPQVASPTSHVSNFEQAIVATAKVDQSVAASESPAVSLSTEKNSKIDELHFPVGPGSLAAPEETRPVITSNPLKLTGAVARDAVDSSAGAIALAKVTSINSLSTSSATGEPNTSTGVQALRDFPEGAKNQITVAPTSLVGAQLVTGTNKPSNEITESLEPSSLPGVGSATTLPPGKIANLLPNQRELIGVDIAVAAIIAAAAISKAKPDVSDSRGDVPVGTTQPAKIAPISPNSSTSSTSATSPISIVTDTNNTSLISGKAPALTAEDQIRTSLSGSRTNPETREMLGGELVITAMIAAAAIAKTRNEPARPNLPNGLPNIEIKGTATANANLATLKANTQETSPGKVNGRTINGQIAPPEIEVSDSKGNTLKEGQLPALTIVDFTFSKIKGEEGKGSAIDDDADDSAKQTSNASGTISTTTKVLSRPTCYITKNKTLVDIAEELFHNGDLAWLIADLNTGHIRDLMIDGKRVVEFTGRQQINLPVWEDIVEFQRNQPANAIARNLVTVVADHWIDRELLDSTLDFVSMAPRTRPLFAASFSA